MGMKSSAGEIIQVQGGHIVRSTGRKDRHSKVYTAKGPRDRRVRLAAHTAIQFYDVQDRLGYDRPSKAVDWLIKKAKSSIDKLAPWHTTGNPNTNTNTNSTAATDTDPKGNSSEIGIGEQSESSLYNFQLQRHLSENPDENSSFIPQHLDSDAMKSFFPTSSANTSLNFQSYPHDQTQDLCLSLQSFQDPELIRNTNHSNSMQFDDNFQRMVAWNGDPDTENRGFLFNSPPPLLGQSSAFTQRGPLQSSFAPTVRAWDEIPIGAAAAEHQKWQAMHQNSIFGSRFVSDGLPRFRIPARIHGEEQHNVVSDKPYSASSSSQHWLNSGN